MLPGKPEFFLCEVNDVRYVLLSGGSARRGSSFICPMVGGRSFRSCVGWVWEGSFEVEGASIRLASRDWLLIVGDEVRLEEVAWLVGWCDEVRKGGKSGVASTGVNYCDIAPFGQGSCYLKFVVRPRQYVVDSTYAGILAPDISVDAGLIIQLGEVLWR